eukprot:GFUD01043607.1.p1 GENE.GFUD01043607.1~~GFUD01043607.1.p1  ORF type:complete len:229 (-),score=65.56 GFUD01043607.1:151-837(-)
MSLSDWEKIRQNNIAERDAEWQKLVMAKKEFDSEKELKKKKVRHTPKEKKSLPVLRRSTRKVPVVSYKEDTLDRNSRSSGAAMAMAANGPLPVGVGVQPGGTAGVPISGSGDRVPDALQTDVPMEGGDAVDREEIVALRLFKTSKEQEAALLKAKDAEKHKRKRLRHKESVEQLKKDKQNLEKTVEDVKKALKRTNTALKEVYEKGGSLLDLSAGVRATCLALIGSNQ